MLINLSSERLEMRINYKFRVYPNRKERKLIDNQLEICRNLYNRTLEQKINIYKEKKQNLSLYTLHNILSEWKKSDNNFKSVHSQVLQNVQARVELAFQRFFREKKGFPRFKGKYRYRSLTYPQSGFKINDKHIYLSKIGYIKYVRHREIFGKVKTVQIIKNTSGKFYVIISTDGITQKEFPKTNKSVGIDCGIITLATLSNGEKIDNPRFYKNSEKRLAKVNRRFSKNKSDKNRHSLTLVYEKITNKRQDFLNKCVLSLVNKFDIICIEKLNIEKMKSYKEINKSIRDCSWGIFRTKLVQKAASATNKTVIEVNPVNTSRICYQCGYLNDRLQLKERTFQCTQCNYVLCRDINASLNILRLGIQSVTSLC
jgi:putative transposase